MLLAADAGITVLAAKLIVTAAIPTGAASFLTFTLTPFLCRPCIHRGRYPAASMSKRNCGDLVCSMREGRHRLVTRDSADAITTAVTSTSLAPNVAEGTCDADGKPLPVR